MRKTLLLALCSLIGSFSIAQSESYTVYTQEEAVGKHCADYLRLKKTLWGITQRIQDDYRKDKVFISKFRQAQAQWESYRDAQLAMIFSEKTANQSQETTDLCRCSWLIKLTNERIDYLLHWRNDFNDCDACAGSSSVIKRRALGAR
jgi:uncharacterized protein YecT (DUF1311 family)